MITVNCVDGFAFDNDLGLQSLDVLFCDCAIAKLEGKPFSYVQFTFFQASTNCTIVRACSLVFSVCVCARK